MIQDADKLQNEFKELCKNNGVRGSFAYFIDHDHRAMFSFNDINDSELMHAAASIAVHSSEKSSIVCTVSGDLHGYCLHLCNHPSIM